jgi:hypothetical protein
MSYAVENALFQWREGEQRVRGSTGIDEVVRRVVDELRRRLGGSFTIAELAELYGSGTDWAESLASADVVDAAFGVYAREARDFAGGKVIPRPPDPRPLG